MIFEGLTSLCMIPFAWQKAKASKIYFITIFIFCRVISFWMLLRVNEEKLSKIRAGVLDIWSKQTSRSLIIFGPSLTACRILISLKIFGCLTGFSNLTTTLLFVLLSMPSNTSLYFPLPKGMINSQGSHGLKFISSYSQS